MDNLVHLNTGHRLESQAFTYAMYFGKPVEHTEEDEGKNLDREGDASFAETVEQYPSYEAAVKAATNFITYDKSQPRPQDKPLPIKLAQPMAFYRSKANLPPGINGKYVGLGIKKTPTSNPIDLIRLDYDPNKGFHFNVFALSRDRTWRDDDRKLACVFPVQTNDPNAELLELVQPLQSMTVPVRLWELWSAGKKP
ncbi:hypothetical protein PQX77_022267 [Marasmius sp. AFHP31]|nr:hypothetical protein PQX77_022267 [Marasmius sp. AFHP31]